MKKLLLSLLLLCTLSAVNARADADAALSKAGQGLKTGGQAAVNELKKGGEATAKGVKKAGEWTGEKLDQAGKKLKKAFK